MQELYSKSRYSILTVDDDDSICFMMDRWIKREGYSSYTAGNASEALDLISSKKIDMAFIDYRLPGTDGFSLIETLRQDYSFPMIVISGDSADIKQIQGLRSGADDYITKPFNEFLLMNKLEACLRRSYHFAIKSSIPLNNGNVFFYLENNEISDGRNSLSLSNKEAIILKTLIDKIGNPVTSDEICAKLNSADEKDVNQRTVTSTVSRLKGRLADSGIDNSFIENIRGLGYVVF